MSINTAVIGSYLAGSSVVFSILDVLASVGRDWAMLHGIPAAEPVFDISLRTLDGAPYWDVNGRKITPDAMVDEAPVPDLIIVPDLLFAPDTGLPDDFASIANWIGDALCARRHRCFGLLRRGASWLWPACSTGRRRRPIGAMRTCWTGISQR